VGRQDVGDLEALRRRLEGWLERALAERPGLEIPELRFPETSGESSVTLLIGARWPDGGTRRFALRMVPPRSEVFESHDLRMQYQMMQVMHAEGIPAPPLLGYEPDASLLGSEFYVMGFVEGRIPPDIPPMALAGWVKDELDASERAAMWANGLETLAAIHRIDTRRHDLGRLPRAGPGEPAVAAELRKWDSMFKPGLRREAPPGLVPAWEYLMAQPPDSEQVGLCWGDSRVGNVIWRELRPVAVIDWEMANLADPLSDVTWWVWVDRCASLGLGVPPLAGVPEPAEVYERWRERTGASLRHLAWFELFTVARFAIVLERKLEARRRAGAPLVPNFAAPFLPDLLDAARRD